MYDHMIKYIYIVLTHIYIYIKIQNNIIWTHTHEGESEGTVQGSTPERRNRTPACLHAP